MKPFEFKNMVRKSWVLSDQLTPETQERFKRIPRKQRFELYKDIDREIVKCYTKKLADANKQHSSEDLRKRSVIGIAVSETPVEVNLLLVEAASEVLQQMQL